MASRLAALFDEVMPKEVTQIPRIALADGRTSVLVRVAGMNGGENPNLALINGRVLSSGKNSEGHLEIEVMPIKGSLGTTLLAMAAGQTLEIPLVVAPGLRTGREVCFPLQVKEGQAEEVLPKQDFSGDGQWNPLDDYILIANCLTADAIGANLPMD